MTETSPSAGPRMARMDGIEGGRPWVARLRKVGLPVVVVAGAVLFGGVTSAHYPLRQWLFWRYAASFLLSLAWALGCVSTGHLLVKRVLRGVLPIGEQLSVSFAAGVYVFFLLMFLTGLAGLYGPVLFAALPLAMMAAGALPLYRTSRRLARHVRAARRRGVRPPSRWALPIIAFGLFGVLLVYIPTLTPDNVAFDARWQHLPLAEHYVAAGAVRRFPEGWVIGASPHLASFLYTWAFMLPKSGIFDRVELSAHIELVAFLSTLVGIPALVRRVLPREASHGARSRGARSLVGVSWAARFLFPGVFLYDSSLCCGADHIVTLFAIPIFALLIRAYRDLSPRYMFLLALMLAGVILTKYTGAFTMVGFPVLVITARSVWLLVAGLRGRADRKAWYRGIAVAVLAGLALTAPHWAKNWVFYGDPVYPMLSRVFPLRPWTPDSSERLEWGFMKAEFWHPDANLAGLKEAMGVLFTYSFAPNDWSKFHGKVPVFGSLFTLLMFCLPFLGKQRRVWAIFAATHLGIFIWYWIHHQDRYLQALLPWMTVGTAAVIALAWRTHVATRVALSGLIALQVIWGGDVFAIPGHAMTRSPIEDALALISSGYRKDFKLRDRGYSPFSDVARALPAKADVLVHESHAHLGLEAMSVNDFPVNQGGISYGLLGSPREVYDLLKGYGVTHLLWTTTDSKGTDTLAGDLSFFHFATRYGASPRAFGGWTLATMPASPPPEGGSDVVLALACPGGPADGLYHLRDMNVPVFGPRKGKYPRPFRSPAGDGSDQDALVAAAMYAIIDTHCKRDLPGPGKAQFKLVARRKDFDLWSRSGG